LAEPGFDRRRFEARLRTHLLGHVLVARAETASTSDDAWDASATGAADGFTVVADAQTRGRGRAGRSWHTTPGKGLALSVLLHRDCDARSLGVLPLAAGLALARALEALGVRADLKWPNDLLLGGRKIAGVLVESRTRASESEGEDRVVVVGVGVNVAAAPEELPPELREIATSLAAEGHTVAREDVAAEFLTALERLWADLEEGGPEYVISAWRKRAAFWGARVRVATPTGEVTGIARDLDPSGRLLVATDDGREVAVLAGDVTPVAAPHA
jgi:BirA family biotin operon repressor/biotin-[acetyl-CoA-carboxylase] ligase